MQLQATVPAQISRPARVVLGELTDWDSEDDAPAVAQPGREAVGCPGWFYDVTASGAVDTYFRADVVDAAGAAELSADGVAYYVAARPGSWAA